MCEIKVEPIKIDPSVLQLIKKLALALQSWHSGLMTTMPSARTYERDQALLSQAVDFSMTAQNRPQPRRIREGL